MYFWVLAIYPKADIFHSQGWHGSSIPDDQAGVGCEAVEVRLAAEQEP